MANVVYDKFFELLMDKTIDMNTDDIRCALLKDTYVPDAALHTMWSDVSSHEVTGTTNYDLGGKTIQSRTITGKKFDGEDVSWTNSTIPNARWGIVYKVGAGPTSSPLICCLDFGGLKSSSAGEFRVEFNSGGILTFSQTA